MAKDYRLFISQKRRMMTTPKAVVENGLARFGTFDSEFEELNLLDCKNPTSAPSFWQKMRLTLWEAVEVRFPGGCLVAGVSDMGLFGVDFDVIYLDATNETIDLSTITNRKNVSIGPNLLGGSVTEGRTGISHLRFENHFEKGEAYVEGHHESKRHRARYKFALKKISLPSNVSIPFGPNRPLVTEKVFFKASGEIEVDGILYPLDENSFAIIDDHRGYYPYVSHYDWLTFMGKTAKGEPFAFNLTENQSVDPTNYNENLIWLPNRVSLLPPVNFEKSGRTLRFHKGKDLDLSWRIRDDHGMVDLTYTIASTYGNLANALVAKIEYFVTFGKINGFLYEEDGTRHDFVDAFGIGEDKTLHL